MMFIKGTSFLDTPAFRFVTLIAATVVVCVAALAQLPG